MKALRYLERLVKARSGNGEEEGPAGDAVKVQGSKSNRLIKRVKDELDGYKGDAIPQDRCDRMVGLLHLASTYNEGLARGDLSRLRSTYTDLLKEIYTRAPGSLEAPLNVQTPLAFVVSYPRSGNTMMMRMLNMVFQGQILDNFPGGGPYFSKLAYPGSYPLTRIVKDHVARDYFKDDPCVFVVRDGRDTVVSFAYMTYQRGLHKFSKKDDLPDLIRWFDTSHQFGGWANHVRQVKALMDSGNKLLLKYDDIRASSDALRSAVDFVDPGNRISARRVEEAFRSQDTIFENVKSNSKANQTWGIGHEFEADSMFYEWSTNRRGSSWRDGWTAEARRTFHETGATELLLEFGFETDADWWKS